MIFIDLKIALFVVLLGMLCSLGGIGLLMHANEAGWHMYEVLPFGIILLDPSGAVAMINVAARQLLQALDEAEMKETLRQFDDPSQSRA